MTWDMWVTVFCLAAGVYAFWPRRRRAVSSRVESSAIAIAPRGSRRRRTRRPGTLPDVARSLSLTAARCKVLLGEIWVAMREGWQEGHHTAPNASVKLLPDDDLSYHPLALDLAPVNDKRQTTNEPNEAPQTTGVVGVTDVDLTKDRIGAALFLGSKGLTDEAIARIVKKDPAAIMEAMRVPDMRAYRVAKVMAGDYARNLKTIEAVVKATTEAGE